MHPPPAVTALVDTADVFTGARLRLAFGSPLTVLEAPALAAVRGVLEAAEQHARAGRWCVGWLAYEAAGAFDAAMPTHPPAGLLARFLVYDQPVEWPADEPARAPTLRWRGGLDRARFDGDLARIQDRIAEGAVYQVNLTAPLHAEGPDDAPASRALFAALQRAQPGGYAAWIDGGDGHRVLSVSPELFFAWDGSKLWCRPMKGTAPRGATPAEDAAQAVALAASPKERAENVMVLDMLRNDVSRIAEPHSVAVPRRFHTEALPTVWQMTSDVTAKTRAGTGLADVFAALFPCGSVTGAPKVEAMRTIRGLEAAPRGVYCGAVGMVRPGGAAVFNVPIRTVEQRGRHFTCGIGSGIVHGANAASEWAEWQHKRAFLDRASAPFDVLETLRLQDGVFVHRADHLDRMRTSAAHFGYAWEAQTVAEVLDALAARHPHGVWRVRLLAGPDGAPRAEVFPHADEAQPVRLGLAARPLEQAHGEFVRHKTTRRAHYDAFAPTDPAVFDTVLWNTDGALTETTRCNLALRIGGRWLTPSAHCGLLPGIARARALAAGRLHEAVLTREDLARADGVAVLNSLRGWMPAVWAAEAAASLTPGM